MKIKDFTVRLAIVLTMAGGVGACTGKESPNPAGPSPTGGAALLGNWSSSSALPSPAACSDFKWNVTQQSGTSASGSFSAVCPGGVNVNGTATGTLSGTTVSWNAQGTAAVPNLRIMETDIDRLAWDHEIVTHVPQIEDGYLVMPDRPGWGTEPNEEAIRAHPPKQDAGLLNYRPKR